MRERFRASAGVLVVVAALLLSVVSRRQRVGRASLRDYGQFALRYLGMAFRLFELGQRPPGRSRFVLVARTAWPRRAEAGTEGGFGTAIYHSSSKVVSEE